MEFLNNRRLVSVFFPIEPMSNCLFPVTFAKFFRREVRQIIRSLRYESEARRDGGLPLSEQLKMRTQDKFNLSSERSFSEH